MRIIILTLFLNVWIGPIYESDNGLSCFQEKFDYSSIDSETLDPKGLNLSDKMIGIWDHSFGTEKGNQFAKTFKVGKSMSVSDLGNIVGQNIRSVAFIGGFEPNASERQWRKRLEFKGSRIQKYSPDKIPVIILMDEPFGHGFETRQLERLIEMAREVIGKNYRFTFTFMRNSIDDAERELPKNLDLIWTNFYPFYKTHISWAESVKTREDFFRVFKQTLDNLKCKAPEAEYIFTGQAFYSDGGQNKWAKPPIESPIWYYEFIAEYEEIIGLFWWKWRSSRQWVGLNEMPQLYKNIRRPLTDDSEK